MEPNLQEKEYRDATCVVCKEDRVCQLANRISVFGPQAMAVAVPVCADCMARIHVALKFTVVDTAVAAYNGKIEEPRKPEFELTFTYGDGLVAHCGMTRDCLRSLIRQCAAALVKEGGY